MAMVCSNGRSVSHLPSRPSTVRKDFDFVGPFIHQGSRAKTMLSRVSPLWGDPKFGICGSSWRSFPNSMSYEISHDRNHRTPPSLNGVGDIKSRFPTFASRCQSWALSPSLQESFSLQIYIPHRKGDGCISIITNEIDPTSRLTISLPSTGVGRGYRGHFLIDGDTKRCRNPL